MPPEEAKFVTHLLQKYAVTDLEKMARDYKNYWQHTPNQIRKKIERFSRLHPELYKEHAKKS